MNKLRKAHKDTIAEKAKEKKESDAEIIQYNKEIQENKRDNEKLQKENEDLADKCDSIETHYSKTLNSFV